MTSHWLDGTDEESVVEPVVRRLSRIAEFAADFDPTIYRAVLRNDGSREAFEAALHQLLNPAAVAA